MPGETAVRELSHAERTQLSQFTQLGFSIVKHYVRTEMGTVNCKTLDAAFDAWLHDTAGDKPRSNEIVYGLGALFGSLLISRSQLEWRIVTDQFGTGMTLYYGNIGGGGKYNHVCVAPIDMVGKRHGEITPFFDALYAAVCKHVDKMGVPLRRSETADG